MAVQLQESRARKGTVNSASSPILYCTSHVLLGKNLCGPSGQKKSPVSHSLLCEREVARRQGGGTCWEETLEAVEVGITIFT